MTKESRPDLWREDINEDTMQSKKRGKTCGLTESIVHLLDSDIVCDLQESVGDNLRGDEAMENIPDVTNID